VWEDVSFQKKPGVVSLAKDEEGVILVLVGDAATSKVVDSGHPWQESPSYQVMEEEESDV